LSGTVLFLVARLGLAVLLAVAALGKILAWQRWGETLKGIGIAGPAHRAVAIAVPAVELTLAVGLLVSPTAQLAAVGSVALFLTFALVVSISASRGRRPECNCFGSIARSRFGWGLALRALLLAGVAAFVAWKPTFTVSAWILGLFAITAILLVFGWLAFILLRRHGQALARIDALEAGEYRSMPAAVAIGSPAPSFLIGDLDDNPVSLVDLLAGERSLLLAFVDLDCGPCRELLPKLARWRAEPGRPRIAVIGSGDRADFRVAAEEAGLTEVLVQNEREVSASYGIAGTPGAVLVSARGIVESEAALGTPAIESLLGAAGNGFQAAETPERKVSRAPWKAAPALAVAATGSALAASVALGDETTDPALAAIKARLDAAKPVIGADFRHFEGAVSKFAKSKSKHASLAKIQSNLATQRRHAVTLQNDLSAIAAESSEALNVREAAVRSVSFQIQAMDEFKRQLGLKGAKARKRSRGRMHNLLLQAREAGYYANVGLGCTGSEC
jgi:uncharacterized membrane protein YphA (DoxX/SURF4 family)